LNLFYSICMTNDGIADNWEVKPNVVRKFLLPWNLFLEYSLKYFTYRSKD